MTEYGRDTSCTTALRPGRLVRGSVLLAEAAFRRLTTPRGMLRGGPEEENYGIDLLELIGNTAPQALAASLPGIIRTELKKDERFQSVTASVAVTTEGPATVFVITITIDAGEGPFTLQLRADEVSVELLGITEG